jgi:Sel1 repeat
LHFGTINLDKVRRLLRPTMRHGAELLRASLMLVAIGGAATAGPLEDAVAAYQRGDYTTALSRWHRLAEQGDAEAQFHLGVMYESGQGGQRNDAEAIKWYRKAAEQGDAVAQFNLGIMYTKGEGVSQNDAEAAQWYRLAANHGLAGAQFNLGMMYAEGQGVSQDYVQAHMWLNLAASQLPAFGKDQRNTTVDARDVVASKMTPTQVTEAQELALEWMAERRHGRRLRALLEALLFKLGKERLVIVPDQVQAQSGDLQDSPVLGSVGLHGLILEDRGSKPTRRALMNPRPSGRR